MRGKTDQQTSLLVLHPQDMIPTHHPIRRIKPIVDAVLRELSPLFDEMGLFLNSTQLDPISTGLGDQGSQVRVLSPRLFNWSACSADGNRGAERRPVCRARLDPQRATQSLEPVLHVGQPGTA